MFTFKTEKISPRVTRIFAFATEIMYLVEGDQRAALLDTGSGFGSLKACVETLTDKPVIVLMTHGHVDHAMGAAEFEECYMSRKDDYIFLEHGRDEFRRKGIEEPNPEGRILAEAVYLPTAGVEHFKDLKGGDSFDLGGVTVDIYDCSGHTRGSLAMLVREERMLLLGDACNYFTFMFDSYSTSIPEYEESLRKLAVEVAGKYDTVLLSHGDGNGHKEMIEDVIAVCQDIQAGKTDDVPFTFMGSTGLIAKAMTPQMQRVDGGRGNIVYNKDKL